MVCTEHLHTAPNLTAPAFTCDGIDPSDPTGTGALRRKFRRQLRRRFDLVRARLRTAIVEQDCFGTDPKSAAFTAPDIIRMQSFASFVNDQWQLFEGSWGRGLIRAAWDSGVKAVGGTDTPDVDLARYEFFFSQELRGIFSAFVQQVTRETTLARSTLSKARIWQLVLGVFTKIAPRFDALANTLVIKVHNIGRIEALRASGVEHFGVRAERVPRVGVTDARRLRRARPTKYVEWVTAGDDRVCPKCEDMEGRIFSYAEVIGLIPLHINCRCAVVGHYLKHDAFEESAHPRAGRGQHSGGQFVGKGGPKPAYGSKRHVPSEEVNTRTTHSPEQEAKIKAACSEVAKKLGYKGVINYRTDDRPFNVGGRSFMSAGTADLATGNIDIYINHVADETVAKGLMAHEIEHVKFEDTLRAFVSQREEVLEKLSHVDAFRAEGRLKPPYDKQFPLFNAFLEFFTGQGKEDLVEGDGVTDYSYAYWKAYKEGSVPLKLAVHETLAEMSRLRQNGQSYIGFMGPKIISYRKGGIEKRHSLMSIIRMGNRWLDLYKLVDKHSRGVE